MASVWEKDRERRRRDAEASERLGRDLPPGEGSPPRYLDPDRPMPDWWYVYMIKRRLEWPDCEDRETMIIHFKYWWPRVASKAETFYETATASVLTAHEMFEVYSSHV